MEPLSPGGKGGPTRRAFLQGAGRAALGLGGRLLAPAVLPLATACGPNVPPYEEPGFDAGEVAHLLPTASHDRILLKTSFVAPQLAPPSLHVDGRAVAGTAVGGTGRFFEFDVRGLAPATSIELALHGADDRPLCASWRLRTLPHPDDPAPTRLRLLSFTCAGGPELSIPVTGEAVFQPLGIRRRLLARALALEPDLAIANGDHVYWDQRTMGGRWYANGPWARVTTGLFDRERPVLGHANEDVLHAAFGPQIADLYGTMLRGVPTFFVRDDHDYTENDDPAVFPPDPFMRRVADATQALYYPELLGPSGSRDGSFGSLRFGTLFEALVYDCRGAMTTGPDPARAAFVPDAREAWLRSRTLESDARHLFHVPSTPILWSAGKWGEWYPDARVESGVLDHRTPKPGWPSGWKAQHDRLLAAAASRSDRLPVFLSGDLHATALGAIHETEGVALARPVVSVLSGTPGTGPRAWPTRVRGTPARPSTTLVAEEWGPPIEENGFTIIDFEPDWIVFSQYRWSESDGIGAIAGLEPFRVHTVRRDRQA